MARGRMISKSLSTSRKYGKLYQEPLGEFCQALYPLLVAHADDFGRLEGDPYTIKHAVVPASPRNVSEVDQALALLESVGLIARSQEVLQVIDFDRHQVGLHKRTESRLPEVSGKVREILIRTEGKGTELNRTEGKGTEGKINGSSGNGHKPSTRSKRPIFECERFVVFDWQLDDLSRVLGPTNLENFNIHEFLFDLSARVRNSPEIIPARDGGRWLQEQVIAEARQRGLTLATVPRLSKRTSRLLNAVAAINRAAES